MSVMGGRADPALGPAAACRNPSGLGSLLQGEELLGCVTNTMVPFPRRMLINPGRAQRSRRRGTGAVRGRSPPCPPHCLSSAQRCRCRVALRAAESKSFSEGAPPCGISRLKICKSPWKALSELQQGSRVAKRQFRISELAAQGIKKVTISEMRSFTNKHIC